MIKSFTKYILTLVALLCITTNAWGAWTGSGKAVKEVSGIYYVLYDDTERNIELSIVGKHREYNYSLTGPGAVLTFEAKRNAGTAVGNLVVAQNVNGSWNDLYDKNPGTSYEGSGNINLNVNASELSFYNNYGSYKRYFRYVHVTMAQYIEDPSQTTFEFGSGKVDDTNSVGSFKIPWCNVPAMNVTKAGEGSEYITVSVENDSEPGKYNTATFTITYDRTKASNLNATVTVTNSYGNYSKTITIKGSTSKYDQTLSWNNESAIETNMQLGRMQTVTATATSGLAVTYSSSDDKVLTVDATGKITAVGLGTATITASQAGNYKYNAAPSITKTFTVWNKNTPIFTPNGFNEDNICHLKVGDKVTLEVLNVSDGLSGDFKVNTDNNILGITRNGNTITIEALNAGTTSAIFTQSENSGIFGAEKKYQFSVTKINNTLAIASSSYSKYVDEEITNIISSVNSDAAVTTSSSDATIAYYDVTSNKILIPNSEAKSFSSQAITITIAQAETYKYTAAEKTITLTVNKYTPKFTWNAGNATYYYKSSIANIFDTSNDDFGYTIVSDNEHVAKVIDNTLHIYNVEETANITVTQVENYKWNGNTETYTITPANPNNHVTFTYTQAMFNDGTITTQKVAGNSCNWDGNGIKLESDATNWDDKFIVIHFEGIPKDISFKYKASTDNVSNGWTEYWQADWYIAESADGKEWSNYPWENLGGDKSNSTSWVTVSNKPLQSTTRYLKLCYSGNFAGYYSDIVVTELEKFEAGPKPLDFGTQSVNYGQQEKQVVFEHANIGRETTVTIEGEDKDYFSVSPTTISNTGRDLYSTAYLNVTFDNGTTVRGDKPYTATLVITDNTGHREEVLLTGIRNGKAKPVFTWNPNNFPYYFNTSIANIVVSSNTDYANCPLEITSSNENIAKVENGRLYIYDQSGEVTFTVIQGGNDNYYDHTETFTFTPKAKPDLEVPFQVTQTIYGQAITVGDNCSWDGDDHHLKLGDGAFDDTKKTAILVFSGRPDKLTFRYATSYNLAVIEIGQTGNPKWEVEESSDGENWKSIWSVRTNSTSWADAEIPLSERTQYVRFSYDGNYAGYFKNINISELVGYKYLRAADGHYLSRGAKWGTQAVVDAFGVVSRLSRYTHDNENIYTRFFFVDNEQYMFETETKDEQRLHEVFTDHGTALNTNHLWQINDNGGIFTIQSANEVGEVSHKGNYITAVNGVLAFTTNEAEATKWQMEDYTEHPQYITDMLNRQAAAAALKDFGEDINTLEKVRNRLKVEDFETREITIQPLELGEQTGESRTIEGMPHIYEQTITVDPGFYRLTVKALYRISNSEIAWKCNQEKGKESVLAYAYANDVQYPIQSVYDSYQSSAFENTDELHNGKYYSTTLTSANVAFNDANRYLNDVYVYVTPDSGKTTGTLRYGIKCPSYVPGAWLAYSTITLTRFGRKEYVFLGTDSHNPTDWYTPANWNRDSVPNQYHNVKIQANVDINSHIEVYGVAIDNNDTIHISSTGGLTVNAEGITNAAADGSSIVIDNTPEGAGFLRIDPTITDTHKKTPRFTVNYTTRAYDRGWQRDEVWQYMGAPGSNAQINGLTDQTLIYNWDEPKGWVKQDNSNLNPMPAWRGYALTQSREERATYKITATPILDATEIHLTCTPSGMKGDNLFVNSFAAPIDIKKIDESDIVETETGKLWKIFYLFNSGSWNQWKGDGNHDMTADGYDQSSAGHYYTIPILSASYTADAQTVIPPMQGVYVYTETPATIRLNYAKHVWNGEASNKPMRSATREESDFQRVRIHIGSENSGADRMYIIQTSNTTRGYDNGYDGDNINANGQANIYTNEPFGKMEVSCANNIDSMYIGITTGEDTTYTLTFGALRGEIYLKDLANDSIFEMTSGGQYHFTAAANATHDLRFQILLHPDLPEDNQNTTSDLTNIINATIWSNGKTIYIANVPVNSIATLYNISGQAVLSSTINYTPYTLNVEDMPKGVYILRINNQAYKFVCE